MPVNHPKTPPARPSNTRSRSRDDISIDPVLLSLDEARNAPRQLNPTPRLDPDPSVDTRHTRPAPPPAAAAPIPCISPTLDESGAPLLTRDEFYAVTARFGVKRPLQDTCVALGLKVPHSANLERLRQAIVNFWYPQPDSAPVAGRRTGRSAVRRDPKNSTPCVAIAQTLPEQALQPLPMPQTPQAQVGSVACNRQPHGVDMGVDSIDDEEALVNEFNIPGANADELMGYEGEDPDEIEDDFAPGHRGDGEHNEEADESDNDNDNTDITAFARGHRTFGEFQTSVRVDATRRAEANRRAGGRKTQKAMVRAWEEFVAEALAKREIKDDIVDEHSLLLYIEYSAERPKRTRKGVPILGTFVGASQLKKLFFGALRIRKEQDAKDPQLAMKRRATSVVVWDAIKNRMDEALEWVRNGLVPSEDAPDIIANTFLSGITDEQQESIGFAFLKHRELRLAIIGHLSWTAQHATGNRGDDFRP